MLDFTINQCKMSRLQTLITTFILAIVVAACGGMADRRLAEAEEIMDNAPDSALVIIQSIRPSDLRSERSRALHSPAHHSGTKQKLYSHSIRLHYQTDGRVF